MDGAFRETLLETINFDKPLYAHVMLAKTANLLNKFTANTVTARLELSPACGRRAYSKSIIMNLYKRRCVPSHRVRSALTRQRV